MPADARRLLTVPTPTMPTPRILSHLANRVLHGGPRLWDRAPAVFAPLVAVKDPRVAFLYALHRSRPRVVFAQVGSNDASFGDPLVPFLHAGRWSGVMVEPVGEIFRRLVRNHGHNPALAFENVAVAPVSGKRTFYFIEERADDPLPLWARGLGSFSLDTILSHEPMIPGLRERIGTTRVPCATFDDLCRKHGLDRLDLVHIDTEGFDYEVLRLVDLARYRPTVVLFEHKHLSPEDRAGAGRLLAEHGYRTTAVHVDTLAVKDEALRESPVLRRAWARVAGASPSVPAEGAISAPPAHALGTPGHS